MIHMIDLWPPEELDAQAFCTADFQPLNNLESPMLAR